MRVQLIKLVQLYALLALLNPSWAQDTLFTPQDLTPSDIKLLLSYYGQDGDQSAVTGGIGTEELMVYSLKYSYARSVSPWSQLLLDVGIDVISSASTDAIDFNMSSASRKDGHETLALGYTHQLRNAPVAYGFKVNGSLESDYLSRGLEVWSNLQSPEKLATYGMNFKVYFADLRWGWLSKPYFKPSRLIYPAELRDTSWFDSVHRNSYHLSLQYRRELTPDLSLAIYPSFIYQRGLLSTPFHRVYFEGQELPRVENFPRRRLSSAIGIQVNKLFPDRAVLRSYYQFYTDDFGIRSHTLRFELPYRFTKALSIGPSVRVYHQDAAHYFAPFQEHLPGAQFYTSDYDLSEFWSTHFGVSVSVRRPNLLPGRSTWQRPGISFKYSHYRRSDGLKAHLFSTLLTWTRNDPFRSSIR